MKTIQFAVLAAFAALASMSALKAETTVSTATTTTSSPTSTNPDGIVELLPPGKKFENKAAVPGGIMPCFEFKFKPKFSGSMYAVTVSVDGNANLANGAVVIDKYGKIIGRAWLWQDDDGQRVGGEHDMYLDIDPITLVRDKVETYTLAVQIDYESWRYASSSVTVRPIGIKCTKHEPIYEGVIDYSIHRPATYTATSSRLQTSGFSIHMTGEIPDYKIKGNGYLGAMFVSSWSRLSFEAPVFEVRVTSENGAVDQLFGLTLRNYDKKIVSTAEKIILRTSPETAIVRFKPIVAPISWGGGSFYIYGGPGSRLTKNNIVFTPVPSRCVLKNPDDGTILQGWSEGVSTTVSK